jgi:pimeloyl-ACP methyl ester carboxylesterase
MRYIIIILINLNLFTSCTVMKQSKDRAYKRIEEDSTMILNTKRFGNIEYVIDNKEGTPVLVIHGIVGGYDQGVQTAKNLLPGSQQYISISRFGYLRSDMPAKPTPANQCEAIMRVLEHNEIKNVILLATSAGGTIAFKFALSYPDYVKGMILIGSGYPNKMTDKIPKGAPAFVFNDFFFTLFVNHMQGTLLKMFGVSKEEYEHASSYEREQFDNMMKTLLPVKPRKRGIINDNKVINPDMMKNCDAYPIEKLNTSVLVLHAKNDPMASLENMKEASERLKNKKVIVYEQGGHILFGHSQANKQHISDFIERISK